MGWPPTHSPTLSTDPTHPTTTAAGPTEAASCTGRPRTCEAIPFWVVPSEGRVAVDVGGLGVVGRPAVMPDSGILGQFDPRGLKGQPITTMGPCRARTCRRAPKRAAHVPEERSYMRPGPGGRYSAKTEARGPLHTHTRRRRRRAPCLASAIGTGQNKRSHINVWVSHTAGALGLWPRRPAMKAGRP